MTTIRRIGRLAIVLGFAVGCGGGFVEELTVDTVQIEMDPLFKLVPEGAEVVDGPSMTGTSTSFSIRMDWGSVSEEAFHTTLRAATVEHQTQFLRASCRSAIDDNAAQVRVSGFKVSGDYSVSVDYRMTGDELTLRLGGSNGMKKLEPSQLNSEQPDAANTPALHSENCSKEELSTLTDLVR